MGRMSRHIKAIQKRAAERAAAAHETPPQTPVIFTQVGNVAVEIQGQLAETGMERTGRRAPLLPA